MKNNLDLDIENILNDNVFPKSPINTKKII